MPFDIDELRSLPAEEKLRLIELLWDGLGESCEPIPLPAWIDAEARKRSEQMRSDPTASVSHDEAWQRIKDRHV